MAAVTEAAVDQVLPLLQSPDNALRRQAEQQLDAWSMNPQLLTVLMTRAHVATSAGSRQLAATVLSWKLVPLWKQLGPEDQQGLQAAMLQCFSSCQEPAVLRQLGEACNALCQSYSMARNGVWQELVAMVGTMLNGESAVHRHAALLLLASLVDGLGLRLKPCYTDIGATLAPRIRDSELDVRIAALGVAGALAASWVSSQDPVTADWKATADATLEVAAAALSGDASAGGTKVVAAALRCLGRLVPRLRDASLAAAAIELACGIVGAGGQVRAAESCCVQALQLLRSIARRSPELVAERGLASAVRVACQAAKDPSPNVDDLDEVSPVAAAARDCLRALSRAGPQATLPLVYEAAQATSQSKDAMDRAAAVHIVVYSLCGAREAPPDWAVPLVRALGDGAIWVRHAACEGVALLADALRPADSVTQGVLLLIVALAERLPQESQPGVRRKMAEAMAALFQELSTDEAAEILGRAVPHLVQALPAAYSIAEQATAAAAASRESDDADTATQSVAAVAAVAGAIGAAATAAADTYAPYAASTAAVLVPLLRAALAGSTSIVTADVFAACLHAAGAVVGAAYAEPTFRAYRDELAQVAQQVVGNAQAPSEVRASAHHFFSSVAFASFEEFAPTLTVVVPPAVAALGAADGSEEGIGSCRRAVRTGGQEERVRAAEALGVYAAAVGGKAFAAHLPTVVPVLCSQAKHSSPEIRAAVANALGRLGRILDELAAELPEGSGDRAACGGLAQAIGQALVELIGASDASDGAAALRNGLLAKEDFGEFQVFMALLGPQLAGALAAAGAGTRAEDVESEDGSEAGDDEDEEA